MFKKARRKHASEDGVWLQTPTTFVGLSIEGGRFRAPGKIQQGGQRVLTQEGGFTSRLRGYQAEEEISRAEGSLTPDHPRTLLLPLLGGILILLMTT